MDARVILAKIAITKINPEAVAAEDKAVGEAAVMASSKGVKGHRETNRVDKMELPGLQIIWTIRERSDLWKECEIAR